LGVVVSGRGGSWSLGDLVGDTCLGRHDSSCCLETSSGCTSWGRSWDLPGSRHLKPSSAATAEGGGSRGSIGRGLLHRSLVGRGSRSHPTEILGGGIL
jgi:hypothetical protein